MPRIPYTPNNIVEPKEIVDLIRARRGGNLLNLDRMLLHSPALARGWNGFLGEVRGGLALSPKLRELAMCTVAVLNGAEYEFHHHAPEFLKAGGTVQQVAVLHQPEISSRDIFLFDASERATLQLTIEMTCHVQIKNDTFLMIRENLPDNQQVVELIGVIAAYNMVSRFLVALEINPE